MKYTYLTPGPGQLYFTAEYHIKQALKAGIPSISHRSEKFRTIYSSLKKNLTELLKLPDNYSIFLLSSATEAWERIAQNLIKKESFHFSNGAFAEKFISTMEAYGKNVTSQRVQEGQPFDIKSIMIPENAEHISITQNETSTGTRFPLEDIYTLRKAFPEKLISVDAVSSLPYENFDFSQLDCLYVSVQKCFGLPAGLGVWFVNDRCINKAQRLSESGIGIGHHHSIPALQKLYEKDQTPETPNVLNIYLLSKIVEDMLLKGIDQIRREIDYKAALMYQSISQNPSLKPFVEKDEIRSKTVIVAETDIPADVIGYLESKGFIVGSGYGKFKDRQFRIANFPTHSKESFERLADLIEFFAGD